MKRRNRTWGCKRIAEQIALAFGVDIDKDVVRRILAIHFHPEAGSEGPSWLSLIGHAKDSLWSLDLFQCESAILRTYWVLVVMDQFTRRIVGFAVHRGVVDGLALCRMFNRTIHGQTPPKYLSSDHDPLYRFHQWQGNLRVLMVQGIKTVPYVPLSHPFVERLIGTTRREYLDRTLLWTAADLEQKRRLFQDYFNRQRVHSGLGGQLPQRGEAKAPLNFASYRWQTVADSFRHRSLADRLLVVGVAPMRDPCHIDRSGRVVNLVHNAIITNPNTPFVYAPFEFFAAARTWSFGQMFDTGKNAGDDFCGQRV
jgi:putative transposase